MHTHLKQETTFYEQLQNTEYLDLRDKRGKRLCLSHVLLGLAIGLLRNRDGNLSSIHRSMVNKNKELCLFLGVDNQRVVSRSHLPIILQKVNLVVFETLLFDYYKLELNEEQKEWFAGDGKELRGSIDKGDKRGEALVQLVRHRDRKLLGQNRYNGKKESEKLCLRELLSQTGALNQKITADALHLSPKTTEPIAKAGGVFLIGLKGNQKELLAQMEKCSTELKPVNQIETIDRGHGRLDQRAYFQYDISDQCFDARWTSSKFKSLIRVERNRLIINTGKQNQQTSYYISNGRVDQQTDYFKAIRNHWSVEATNHIRDVTLQEDQLRTKKNQ